MRLCSVITIVDAYGWLKFERTITEVRNSGTTPGMIWSVAIKGSLRETLG